MPKPGQPCPGVLGPSSDLTGAAAHPNAPRHFHHQSHQPSGPALPGKGCRFAGYVALIGAIGAGDAPPLNPDERQAPVQRVTYALGSRARRRCAALLGGGAPESRARHVIGCEFGLSDATVTYLCLGVQPGADDRRAAA